MSQRRFDAGRPPTATSLETIMFRRSCREVALAGGVEPLLA